MNDVLSLLQCGKEASNIVEVGLVKVRFTEVRGCHSLIRLSFAKT